MSRQSYLTGESSPYAQCVAEGLAKRGCRRGASPLRVCQPSFTSGRHHRHGNGVAHSASYTRRQTGRRDYCGGDVEIERYKRGKACERGRGKPTARRSMKHCLLTYLEAKTVGPYTGRVDRPMCYNCLQGPYFCHAKARRRRCLRSKGKEVVFGLEYVHVIENGIFCMRTQTRRPRSSRAVFAPTPPRRDTSTPPASSRRRADRARRAGLARGSQSGTLLRACAAPARRVPAPWELNRTPPLRSARRRRAPQHPRSPTWRLHHGGAALDVNNH
jgi:hypothetical protein